jgi:hypothetical protein
VRSSAQCGTRGRGGDDRVVPLDAEISQPRQETEELHSGCGCSALRSAPLRACVAPSPPFRASPLGPATTNKSTYFVTCDFARAGEDTGSHKGWAIWYPTRKRSDPRGAESPISSPTFLTSFCGTHSGGQCMGGERDAPLPVSCVALADGTAQPLQPGEAELQTSKSQPDHRKD